MDVHPATFSAWESFYVIVGSSAGALIGLQFVVIALIAETRRASTLNEIDAFGTPTILHFVGSLVVSLIVSAPWPSPSIAAVVLGAIGIAGMVYVVIVIRRARRQTGYQLVMEDWIWHIGLPFVAYAALTTAASTMRVNAEASLFIVASAAVLLLFIGIHNAWDTVTYLVVSHREDVGKPEGPTT